MSSPLMPRKKTSLPRVEWLPVTSCLYVHTHTHTDKCNLSMMYRHVQSKGALPNYFGKKNNVIVTLTFDPPPPLNVTGKLSS